MCRNVKWIIGAMAAALWIAPAAAQTGSATQGQEKPYTTGTGVDSTKSNSDPAKAPAHERSTATQGGTGSSAIGSDTNENNDHAVGGVGIGSGADATKSNTDPSKQPGYESGTGTGATSGGMSGSASSDTSSSGASGAGGTASADMAQTAAKLHAANQAEIQGGKYMKEHAQNKKVKDFANKMVKDHTSLDKDLMSFAQKKGIDLTSASSAAGTEDAKAQEQMSALQGLSGAQADQHYMRMMVQDHQKDVNEVKTAQQQARSENQKDFANLLGKAEKKISDHLKDAEKIERDLTQRQARNPGK